MSRASGPVQIRDVSIGGRPRFIAPLHLLSVALCLVVAGVAPAFAAAPFPANGAAKGCRPLERLTFTKADLYGYIDGGAELFLEFGFEELQVQKYAANGGEVSLDLYRMETPEGALGIYLAKRGKESPVRGVEARNTGDRYQISALKGRYFLQAGNYKGQEAGLAAAVALLNALTGALPEEPSPDLFADFPGERRVEGSEMLFLGPYALERLFTFGEGDILSQQGKILGASVDYAGPSREIYTRYRVEYPDGDAAVKAFSHLRKSLDPEMSVTGEGEGLFRFKDFSGKFGDAELDGAVLWLRTGLVSEPQP